MKQRIMYIERRCGEARIGRVSFSRTGKTLSYQGKTFHPLGGDGPEANYLDVETREEYRIADCRKDGADRRGGERQPVAIDEDVREEYWAEIRGLPENADRAFA
jgi:hypothetical protein